MKNLKKFLFENCKVSKLYCLFFLLLTLTAVSCNSSNQPLEPGAKLNNYELFDLSDKKVNLTDLTRDKVALIHFWASWCDTCSEELPQINAIFNKLSSSGVTVISIVVDDQKENIEKAKVKYNLNFPILFDKDGGMTAKFKLEGLPETFIVNKENKLILFADPVGEPTVRIMGNREWMDPVVFKQIEELL